VFEEVREDSPNIRKTSDIITPAFANEEGTRSLGEVGRRYRTGDRRVRLGFQEVNARGWTTVELLWGGIVVRRIEKNDTRKCCAELVISGLYITALSRTIAGLTIFLGLHESQLLNRLPRIGGESKEDMTRGKKTPLEREWLKPSEARERSREQGKKETGWKHGGSRVGGDKGGETGVSRNVAGIETQKDRFFDRGNWWVYRTPSGGG